MKGYQGLTGEPLENWLQEFISSSLQLENYIPSAGQIPLSALDPEHDGGEHLELDGLLLLHKTCIIFEITSQKGDFKKKIEKFLKKL